MDDRHHQSSPVAGNNPPEFGSRPLIFDTDPQAGDPLADGYQEVQIQYIQTCSNCGTSFSPEKPKAALPTCPQCNLPKNPSAFETRPGFGDEAFPFEPESMKLVVYMLFWFGRMNRMTFAVITLVLLPAAAAIGGSLLLVPVFLLHFVQMIKREHDLGRGWVKLIPLGIVFLAWFWANFLNLEMIEKMTFVLFAFWMTTTLGRLCYSPGIPGPNRFGPIPGPFRPFAELPAPRRVGILREEPPASDVPPAESSASEAPASDAAPSDEQVSGRPPAEPNSDSASDGSSESPPGEGEPPSKS